MRRALLAAVVLALLPASAAAQVQPPGTGDPGGFHNVLGVGQGGGATAAELADHVALGGDTRRASRTSSPSTATSPRWRRG